METALTPAAAAFDAIAAGFDAHFGAWQSVAAQRAAVRSVITSVVPAGGRLLELGGGTGEDASWLTARGYRVTVTDPSPTMVAVASHKLSGSASTAERLGAEELDTWLQQSRPHAPFDAAFSNFAALNCVSNLEPVAKGLARALKPGAAAIMVLFGTASPGEVIVQLLRGSPRAAMRRAQSGLVQARLHGHSFEITYHRPRQVQHAFAPWFELVQQRGIGVFVPPSAAEPWISAHPRLLRVLASLDRIATRPLALLGDHVLYHFVRNARELP
jgi:SAM-dependent methyltransferase